MFLKRITESFNLPRNILHLSNNKNSLKKKGENNCTSFTTSPKNQNIIFKDNKILPSEKCAIKKYNDNIKNNNPLKIRNNYKETFVPIKQVSLEELKNYDCKNGLHVKPKSIGESIAYGVVRTLRFFADIYFQKDYIRRVVVLETVAAIPGMVGGLFHHLYSLRNLVDNKERIQILLKEAENERQHLLTFLKIMKPNIFDRFVIKITQAVFFNTYMVFYFLFPRTCHRFVGYLEEEAIRSYTAFEDEILCGNIKNINAPQISKDYWKLPDNSRLIDVVRAVRIDEVHHRDANHEIADKNPFEFKE
ncbi:Alternative oxidase [Spraguea lophii 42_110]|uniref:Alternative oxidase n=2 Tax=Spraguea lophii TaxID=51541 RepID=S7WC03_SPRLO|nr:Alternative oxidase [Spraguea lophii 42_110]